MEIPSFVKELAKSLAVLVVFPSVGCRYAGDVSRGLPSREVGSVMLQASAVRSDKGIKVSVVNVGEEDVVVLAPILHSPYCVEPVQPPADPDTFVLIGGSWASDVFRVPDAERYIVLRPQKNAPEPLVDRFVQCLPVRTRRQDMASLKIELEVMPWSEMRLSQDGNRLRWGLKRIQIPVDITELDR